MLICLSTDLVTFWLLVNLQGNIDTAGYALRDLRRESYKFTGSEVADDKTWLRRANLRHSEMWDRHFGAKTEDITLSVVVFRLTRPKNRTVCSRPLMFIWKKRKKKKTYCGWKKCLFFRQGVFILELLSFCFPTPFRLLREENFSLLFLKFNVLFFMRCSQCFISLSLCSVSCIFCGTLLWHLWCVDVSFYFVPAV